MSKPIKVVVTKQRTVHTYAELWHASDCVLRAGIQNPQGASSQFLSSVVLTAFAFEAYLNHAGAVTFDSWPELEKLSPWSKLKILCEKLGVSLPNLAGERPLQTITQLLSFRNTIAHGRSREIHSKPIERTVDNYHGVYGEPLLTEWEKLIQTADFASRAREDVRMVLEAIHVARLDKKEYLFTFGMGMSGASIVPEQ